MNEVTRFQNPVQTDINYAEHSASARAKKIIPGPLYVVPNAANKQTILPIQIAAAGPMTGMLGHKAYRVISDGSFTYNLSVGVPAAAAFDVYVPADTAIIIAMRDFDTMTIKIMNGAFVQAVEIE